MFGLDLDKIVFIRHKEVIVYPDDSNKPELGNGLNKKAQITLDKVWPVDKTNKASIRSPEKLQSICYEEKLQKACIKLGARFIEYRLETGSWVFKVDHFSKYGLNDSDEDEEIVVEAPKKKVAILPLKEQQPQQGKKIKTLELRKKPEMEAEKVKVAEDEDQENDQSEVSRLSAISAHPNKVQLMKASLFEYDHEEMEHQSRPVILESRPTVLERRDPLIEDIAHSIMGNKEQHKALFESMKRQQKPEEVRKIPVYSLHAGYDKFVQLANMSIDPVNRIETPGYSKLEVRPLHESLLRPERLHFIADSGFANSRRFRTGWTKQANFTTTNSTYGISLNATKFNEDLSESFQSWIEMTLKHSEVDFEGECPMFRVNPEDAFELLELHVSEASDQLKAMDSKSVPRKVANFLRETKKVFDLTKALWGKIPGHGDEELRQFQDSHLITMLRKQNVSNWLEEVVRPEVEKDLLKNGNDAKAVLNLLSGNKMSEACEKSVEIGDFFAATLISTSGGHNSIRGQLCYQQLERWREMKADDFIDLDRLRLYALLSGIPTWQTSNADVTINVCDDLDWKRAFACHLWFLTSPTSSVEDAFNGFQEAFLQGDCAQPKPEYCKSDFSDFRDVKFHLLKLYSDRSHSMESLLNPSSHTQDILDHSLSWLLFRVLKAFGYTHMSSEKENALHLNFASQLENFGFWHFAIFPILHIQDENLRSSKTKEILHRYIETNKQSMMDDDEQDKEGKKAFLSLFITCVY